jgi:hypothetical protein
LKTPDGAADVQRDRNLKIVEALLLDRIRPDDADIIDQPVIGPPRNASSNAAAVASGRDKSARMPSPSRSTPTTS